MSVHRLVSLVRLDLANVRRDRLLWWTAVGPLLLALLLRFGFPSFSAWLARRHGVDLGPYHGLVMSFFLMTPPAMVGMIVGFLLLDERDDRTLAALAVTPLPLGHYLAYRVAAPLLAGIAGTLLCYPLAGLAPIPFAPLGAIASLAALTGPITALFLASFAANKVAGFALVKIVNLVNILPVWAFFVAPQHQFAAGFVPAFWPMKALWQASSGQDWRWAALLGLAVNLAFLGALLARFKNRVLAP